MCFVGEGDDTGDPAPKGEGRAPDEAALGTEPAPAARPGAVLLVDEVDEVLGCKAGEAAAVGEKACGRLVCQHHAVLLIRLVLRGMFRNFPSLVRPLLDMYSFATRGSSRLSAVPISVRLPPSATPLDYSGWGFLSLARTSGMLYPG